MRDLSAIVFGERTGTRQVSGAVKAATEGMGLAPIPFDGEHVILSQQTPTSVIAPTAGVNPTITDVRRRLLPRQRRTRLGSLAEQTRIGTQQDPGLSHLGVAGQLR